MGSNKLPGGFYEQRVGDPGLDNDVSSYTVNSLVACIDICRSNAACNVVFYRPSGNDNCKKFVAKKKFTSNKGAFGHGHSECGGPNSGTETIHTGITQSDDCAVLCANQPTCKEFMLDYNG